MTFGVIIPARYGSERLPGKPLLPLAGRPMITHVLENAQRAGASFVLVATDDERIAKVVHEAGGDAVLTSREHPTGTDRLAEVARRRDLPRDAVVVNVQGDEPLLEPELVARVAEALRARPGAGIATLAVPLVESKELFNPNVVKVVLDRDQMALYFSRAPLPWLRDAFGALPGPPPALPSHFPFFRHVGLYAYRVQTLLELASHPVVDVERAESLEQLRALWLGVRIHVSVLEEAPALGVDTYDDVARVEQLLGSRRAAMLMTKSAPAAE